MIESTDARILIVDDESFVRTTVRRMLRMLGNFEIKDATDGQAALTAVVAFRPQLILCDIRMVPMSGLEFVRQLRTLTESGVAYTRVVMLTGTADESVVANAMQLGISGYLVKPVSALQLRKRIEPILADIRAGAPA